MKIDKLIKEHPWGIKFIDCKSIRYTAVEWVMLCIQYKTAIALARHLNCKRQTIAGQNKKFKELDHTSNLDTKFLKVLGVKKCSDCKKFKNPKEFHNRLNRLQSECKKCNKIYRQSEKGKIVHRAASKAYDQTEAGKVINRANKAKRRAAKLNRTPVWADLEAIKRVYADCPDGYHVDHIIPLQGERVSGLHVHNNLQYLTPTENSKKSNKYDLEG